MQSAIRQAPRLGSRSHDARLQDAAADAARFRAWTSFWQDSAGQSRCLANAHPDVRRALHRHWSRLARGLAAGSRILDIGCGAGAVARDLLEARAGLRIVGLDLARVPAPADRRFVLSSETPMEDLPFEAASFDAAVSQFGFEYGDCRRAARELARVLAPGAGFSFLVHHANSSVVCKSRAGNAALRALLGEAVERAFMSGNAGELDGRIASIASGAPADALVGEAAAALRARIGCARTQRLAVWTAVVEALAPERAILSALEAACVAPADLTGWLGRLCGPLEIRSAREIRQATGEPIAWCIEGVPALGADA